MKRNISGILLLDKPLGLSSNGALQVVKRLFKASKAGHTGSLDPKASGMLPICFGLTSGVITTLGVVVGLNSATESSAVVLSGILVIAIADALSDALGIHISEESADGHNHNEVWESTLYTFLSKFFVALTFVAPVLLLPIHFAIFSSILWGLFLITSLSYYIAKQQGIKPLNVVLEHVAITVVVIVITYYVGGFVGVIG